MAGNAGLEALAGRQIHVVGVGHRRAVNLKIIGEGLPLSAWSCTHAGRPHAFAVFHHAQWLAVGFSHQKDLFGLGCFHAENDATLLIVGRHDGPREQPCHHRRRELLFLAGGGGSRLAPAHGRLGSLGVEQQRHGARKEIFGIHPCMAEFVGCKLLHRADALLVEKLHVVAGRAEKEVVGAHAQPEQVQLAVGVGGIVVNAGNVGGSERAVGAQVGELVEVAQPVHQPLVAAAREAADGAVVAVVDGAVVLLNVGHKVVVEVLAEHVAAETRLRHAGRSRHRGQQLVGVAVRQHDNHFLGLPLGQQVVEDVVHAPYLIIHLLGVGGAADEVEHGEAFLRVLAIRRRQIHHGMVGGTKALGVVADVM